MTRTILGLVLALGAMGCGAGGTAGTGTYLVSGIEGRTDLYVAPGIETRPLTLSQLGEENADRAIAVDVEVYDQIAVAFARDAAGNAIYSRDAIVGLWNVLDRNVVPTDVTEIDGETSPGDDTPVYVPGGSFSRAPGGLRGDNPIGDGGNFDVIDFSELIDTAIFEDAAVWADLNAAHPGCT